MEELAQLPRDRMETSPRSLLGPCVVATSGRTRPLAAIDEHRRSEVPATPPGRTQTDMDTTPPAGSMAPGRAASTKETRGGDGDATAGHGGITKDPYRNSPSLAGIMRLGAAERA